MLLFGGGSQVRSLVLLNRIKPRTAMVGETQSALIKMFEVESRKDNGPSSTAPWIGPGYSLHMERIVQ